MITNEQARLIVDAFDIEMSLDEENDELIDLETKLAFLAIVEMAQKG